MKEGYLSAVRREWKLLLFIVVGLSLLAAFFAFDQNQRSEPLKHEYATIVRFGLASSETGDYPILVVRRADGKLQQLATSRAVVSLCRRGDRIELAQQGAITSIGQRACQAGRSSR
ncbi:hypothetical protein ACFSCW_14870 [Sphingomonas tabacisoli]|uniref:NusG domain-containing protein n=1 Tax=Sphingomonas tabacisoli TaxID=2249466 RepID=A0ABW4I6K4_9SPHN